MAAAAAEEAALHKAELDADVEAMSREQQAVRCGLGPCLLLQKGQPPVPCPRPALSSCLPGHSDRRVWAAALGAAIARALLWASASLTCCRCSRAPLAPHMPRAAAPCSSTSPCCGSSGWLPTLSTRYGKRRVVSHLGQTQLVIKRRRSEQGRRADTSTRATLVHSACFGAPPPPPPRGAGVSPCCLAPTAAG